VGWLGRFFIGLDPAISIAFYTGRCSSICFYLPVTLPTPMNFSILLFYLKKIPLTD